MQPPIFFQKEFQKYIYILLRVIVLLFEMLTHNTAVLLVLNNIGQADVRIKSWIIKGFGIRVSDGPAWSFWASGE